MMYKCSLWFGGGVLAIITIVITTNFIIHLPITIIIIIGLDLLLDLDLEILRSIL